MILNGVNPELKEVTPRFADMVIDIRFSLYENIIDDINYLVYEGHFTRSDVLTMTVHERRRHLQYVSDRIKKHNEDIENMARGH